MVTAPVKLCAAHGAGGTGSPPALLGGGYVPAGCWRSPELTKYHFSGLSAVVTEQEGKSHHPEEKDTVPCRWPEAWTAGQSPTWHAPGAALLAPC